MNAYFQAFVLICMLFAGTHAGAQNDTLYLSSAQIEDIFLKQNLQLIAEKLNIEKSEASVIQARLWPNPTFTIDQVNLWATDAQRQGNNEVIPPLFGSFGKNLEFGLGIDQVILMGGKRGKLIDREKVTRDMAAQYFEELLCNLKAELRSTCAELRYAQQYGNILEKQEFQLNALIANYREQVKQGNISQGQLLRLQAALLEVRSEINESQKEINAHQKDLKTLLNISSQINIRLTGEAKEFQSPEKLSFSYLSLFALDNRPDMKRTILQTNYFNKSLRYEKSQRVPDITLHASYDRGGNCMLNFVGFGVSMDLPFFNRNQGVIKAAEIELRQSITETEYKQTTIRNEIAQALENYRNAYNFNNQITHDFIANLDEISDSYMKNFISKNIGIVEFLDFFDTYKENKRSILAAQKELTISFEELQLAVGGEVNEELKN